MALPAASRARWLPLPSLGREVAASLAAAAAVLAGYLLGSGGDALAVLAAVLGLGLGLVALAEPQWAVAAVLALGMGHLSDAAFAALDVLPPYKVLIGLLAVLLVLRLAATRGRCLVLTGTLALLLFFLGALGGSALFAAHPDAGLARVEDLAREFAIAFLVANLLTTRAGLHRAVWTLVGVGALLAALSLYQTVSGDVSERFFGLAQARSLHIVGALNRPRASGPFGDPNAYGQYLLVFAALALFRAWDERQLLLRLAGLAALGMILAALVLTFSRGAFVGLALACLVLVALRRPTCKGLLIGIVLCAPLAPLTPPSFVQRMATVAGLVPGQEAAVDEVSFRGRWSETLAAVEMFLDRPLLGVGPASFPILYQEYAADLGLEHRREPRAAHSHVLEVAAEGGLLGLGLFLAALGSAVLDQWRAARLFRQAGDRAGASLADSLLLALAAYLAAGLFLPLAYPRGLWLLLGLLVAGGAIAERDRRRLPADAPPPDGPAGSPVPARISSPPRPGRAAAGGVWRGGHRPSRLRDRPSRLRDGEKERPREGA